MKKRITKYHMDGLIALLLFGVFAACLLAVLLTGAGAYKRLTKRDEEDYRRRTCIQYVAARVRQAERPEAVEIESFGGGDALAIVDGDGCITRVYYYDGYLMELYAEADFDLNPEDGERIMEAGGLALSVSDGMLSITVIDKDGKADELRLSLAKSGEESGG